MNKKDPGHNPG